MRCARTGAAVEREKVRRLWPSLGRGYGEKAAFSGLFLGPPSFSGLGPESAADLPGIMPWRASIGPNSKYPGPAPMTLSVANTAEEASPLRGLLPLWVGVFVYAL